MYRRNGSSGKDEFIGLEDYELLDNFEEPSFYDVTTNASFGGDFQFSTPVGAKSSAPTAAEKLDSFRKEVAEAIELDQLRNSMNARVETLVDQQSSEDPYVVPSPPNDPKDVLALIKRAQAIARLKAREELKGKKQAHRQNMRQHNVPKLKVGTTRKLFKKAGSQSTASASTQYPPQYVTAEGPAAVLRAGLRTTNPNLLPKTTLPLLPLRENPPPPTFASVMERMVTFRSRTNKPRATPAQKETNNNPKDELEELDEFEVLEELYGVTRPQQYTQEGSVSHLHHRINALQQKLFQTPSSDESIHEELAEFEALEKQYGAAPYDERHIPNYRVVDLQHRINALHQQLFQSPSTSEPNENLEKNRATIADSVAESDLNQRTLIKRTPRTPPPFLRKRSHSPTSISKTLQSKFSNDVIQDLDRKEFDINDISDLAFSAEELADISIPQFYEDISLDKINLEDITSPDLNDLSISGDDLALQPDYNLANEIQKGHEVNQGLSKQPGLLSSVVNALLGGFRHIFSPSAACVETEEEAAALNLESSLPNIFGTSYSESKIAPTDVEIERLNDPNPKDYVSMVKGARMHEKKQEEGTGERSVSDPSNKEKIETQIRKPGPPSSRNISVQTKRKRKVYPPGEHSPSDIKAIAIAKSLAARIAEQKSGQMLPDIEPLTPVTRLKKKIKRNVGSKLLLVPTNKDWAQVDGTTAIKEDEDFISFSPLKPDEVRMQLRYLKEQADKRINEVITDAEQRQAVAEVEAASPTVQFSPIQLKTPSSPRTEEIKCEKNVTKIGPYGVKEIIKENVTETSTTKNDEVHTATRQVTSAIDQYGNVSYHMQEGEVLTGGDETISEYLDNIRPPDSLNASYEAPSKYATLTPTEIINSLRPNNKIKLSYALPDASKFLTSMINFPQDLTDEELYEIEAPEFVTTPQETTPQAKFSSLPANMYFSPYPKDPRDVAMVKRAQEIQKQMKLEDVVQRNAAKPIKRSRVSISRWNKPTLNVAKRPVPSKPLPLSQKYREAVARARSVHGLQNKTAALNPEVAAEQAAKAAARSAFDALPELDKIKRRMEKFRKLPAMKRRVQLSADVLGTLAAIRANIPPSAEDLPVLNIVKTSTRDPEQSADPSQFKGLSLGNFENIQSQLKLVNDSDSIEVEPQKLYEYDTPKRGERHLGRKLLHQFSKSLSPISESVEYDLMEDFRDPIQNVVLESSDLMPETPPKNVLERYQRLKDAQKKNEMHAAYSYQIKATPSSTPRSNVNYIPIRLVSPDEHNEIKYPIPAQKQEDVLVNIDGTPKSHFIPVKLFRDLEDMPFDELELEDEPTLANISFEAPLTPPPRPSDIIRRIMSKVNQELKENSRLPSPTSLQMIELPEDLPDEELLDVSQPSFSKTPSTPQTKHKSPQVSLPLVWDETGLDSPHSAVSPALSIKVNEPEGPIIIPSHPKDPKDYIGMIERAKAIYRYQKQKDAENRARVSAATINQIPTKPKKIIVPKRAGVKKPLTLRQTLLRKGQKKEFPAEPPPLTQDYIDAVARARLLRGLQNKTATLNPKLAVKIAAKKNAREAALKAYNALPALEKIKVRMERLRKNPKRGIKPTIEQVAYLEALKEMGRYQALTSTPSSQKSTPRLSIRSRAQYPLSVTPQVVEEVSKTDDISLAEFEALEALECPPGQCPPPAFTPLDMEKLISDLQQQQLETPPMVNPIDRLRKIKADAKTLTIPSLSPLTTPQFHYSPITLSSGLPKKPRERSASLKTTSGTNKNFEDLADIEEPSFLETTPLSPIEIPRPRDIIDRVRRQLKQKYQPDVPTGHLIDLRTPPPMLPLPKTTSKELLDLSSPVYALTPPSSPVPSPTTSPLNSPDVSIPKLFERTAPGVPLHPLSLSSEGHVVVPSVSKDPTDFRGMLSRARKIQQHAEQTKGGILEAEKKYTTQLQKKERTPIPPKKPANRRNLVLKKRNARGERSKFDELAFPKRPPQLPEHLLKEIALARALTGLENRTAAAKTGPLRQDKDVTPATLNTQHRSPIRNYDNVISRMKEIKRRGGVVLAKPSLATTAYLDALKGAMEVQQHLTAESPKTRYNRIIASRHIGPLISAQSPERTASQPEISYSPLRLVSPSISDTQINMADFRKQYAFNTDAFESLNELEDLDAYEQPSYVNVTQLQVNGDQYMPLTPPPSPSALISRIREQYEQEKARVYGEIQNSSPAVMEFPTDLPDEEIFDVSAPFFAQSSIRSETPIMSPDITLPRYFEETPSSTEKTHKSTISKQSRSPTDAMMTERFEAASGGEPLMLLPHPEYTNNRPAVGRRGRVIQFVQPKKAPRKVREALLKKILAASGANKEQIQRTSVVGKNVVADPADLLKLSTEYLKQIAKSLSLEAAQPKHTQNAINSQQRNDTKWSLNEVKPQREPQSVDMQPIGTSLPITKRLERIKLSMATKTPTSSESPYSSINTPQPIKIPQYEPLVLAPTPPYHNFEMISAPNIEDMSLHLDDLNDYNVKLDTADADDLEFQLAEAALAAYTRLDENSDIADVETADNFDIAKRIELLEQQLLESPTREGANNVGEYNIIKRKMQLYSHLEGKSKHDEQPAEEIINGVTTNDFEAMEREYM